MENYSYGVKVTLLIRKVFGCREKINLVGQDLIGDEMKSEKSTWNEVQPYISEFFSFWTDGEDHLWAKLMWPGLLDGGMLAMSGAGPIWTRGNICALAILYSEAVTRLGIEPHNHLSIERSDIPDIFQGIGLCENRLVEVREALLSHFGEDQLFSLTLRSIEYGRTATPNIAEIEIYLRDAKKRLPHCTKYREDNLFGIFNGAVLELDQLQGLS